MKKIKIENEKKLRTIAEALIGYVLLKQRKQPGAFVVMLIGELGSGKTTFVKYAARAIGIKRVITSPTFLIFRSYGIPGHAKPLRRLYHADLYRIKTKKELDALGFSEILRNPENIVFIEWADNVKGITSKNSITLKLEHGKIPSERIMIIAGESPFDYLAKKT